MMSSYFLNSLPGAGTLVGVLVFLIGGMLIMLRSLRNCRSQIGEQKQAVVQLAEQLQECILQEISSQQQLEALNEQCKSLNARQQLVEKHGSDAKRIDLAMRMLKRGVGSAETLQDLGLSGSEIKLLLRLHSAPAQKNETPTRLEKALRPRLPEKNQTSAPAAKTDKTDKPDQTKRSSDSRLPDQVSQQGRELAKLFKTRIAS